MREAYLLVRNLLGISSHPFKTLRIIIEEKDLSQAGLILGLPLYLFAAGLIIIRGLRFIIGAPKSPWGPLAKAGGVLLIALTILISFYLFYWLWKVIKLKMKNEK